MEDLRLRWSGKLSPDQQERILDAVYPSLRFQLNIDDLLPYLCQKRMLTRKQKEILANRHCSREEKVDQLISWIQQKGPNSLQYFIDCLKESEEIGHEELLRELESEIERELRREPTHREKNERSVQGIYKVGGFTFYMHRYAYNECMGAVRRKSKQSNMYNKPEVLFSQ